MKDIDRKKAYLGYAILACEGNLQHTSAGYHTFKVNVASVFQVVVSANII